MPIVLGGANGSFTGGGVSTVALELDEPVGPGEALLLFAAYEPGVSDITRSDFTGTYYRIVRMGVRASDEIDPETEEPYEFAFQRAGQGFVMAEWVGFGFSDRNSAPFGGTSGIDGRTAATSFFLTVPQGIAAGSYVIAHSEPFSQVLVDFLTISTAPYAVSWVTLRTWKFLNFTPEDLSGSIGQQTAEDGRSSLSLDPAGKWDSSGHVAPAGASVDPPSGSSYFTDGGDVAHWRTLARNPKSAFEIGVAAYYGTISTTVWGWADWPGFFLGSINRPWSHGNAHFDVFWYAPPKPISTVPYRVGGTFGPQSPTAQDIYETPMPPDWIPTTFPPDPDETWPQLYRNSMYPPGTSGAVRYCAISAFGAKGAWTPQIYRRL